MQTSGEDRRRIRDLRPSRTADKKHSPTRKVVKLDKRPPDLPIEWTITGANNTDANSAAAVPVSRASRSSEESRSRPGPGIPLKTSTIDGLTLDDCVFRFEQVMREGRNADGTPGKFFDLLTSVQLAAAKVEFSRRVKAKVQASAEDTIRREREQNLLQTDADFEHLLQDAP